MNRKTQTSKAHTLNEVFLHWYGFNPCFREDAELEDSAPFHYRRFSMFLS